MLIVTDDNPRSRTRRRSGAAVLAGAPRVPATGARDASRSATGAAAIAEAVALAGPGDAVVVAGKGHEQGQEVDGVVHPFDDRDGAAALALDELTGGRPVIQLTLAEVADAVGGELHDGADPDGPGDRRGRVRLAPDRARRAVRRPARRAASTGTTTRAARGRRAGAVARRWPTRPVGRSAGVVVPTRRRRWPRWPARVLGRLPDADRRRR